MGKSVEVTEVFVVFIFQVDRVTVGSPPSVNLRNKLPQILVYIYIEFLTR